MITKATYTDTLTGSHAQTVPSALSANAPLDWFDAIATTLSSPGTCCGTAT